MHLLEEGNLYFFWGGDMLFDKMNSLGCEMQNIKDHDVEYSHC
jgi:hypothetical protein